MNAIPKINQQQLMAELEKLTEIQNGMPYATTKELKKGNRKEEKK